MRNTSLLLALALATCAAFGSSRASACSPPERGYFVSAPAESLRIPFDGVLVLEAQAFSPEEGPRVVVRDNDGDVLEGALERRSLRTGEIVERLDVTGPELLIWRSAFALEEGATCLATVEQGPTGEPQPLALRLYAGRAEPTEVAIDQLQARLERVSRDLQQRCGEPAPGACTSECEFIDEETMVTLSFELPPTMESPYTFYRLVPRADDAIARGHQAWGGHGRAVLDVHFPERRGEYCAHLEAVDLIDGRVRTSSIRCVPDALVDETLEANAGGCSVTPSAGGASPAPLGLLALGLLAHLRRRR